MDGLRNPWRRTQLDQNVWGPISLDVHVTRSHWLIRARQLDCSAVAGTDKFYSLFTRQMPIDRYFFFYDRNTFCQVTADSASVTRYSPPTRTTSCSVADSIVYLDIDDSDLIQSYIDLNCLLLELKVRVVHCQDG